MAADLPAESGPGALEAAKATASELATCLTAHNTLTPAERSNLVYDLKAALGQVDAIEQAQR